MFSSTRSARRALGSTAVTRAPARKPSAASSAVLPPGPAHRSSQRPAVAVDRRQRQRPGHQLAALVLHQRLAVAHRREPARVTAGQIDAVGRIAGRRAAHLFGEFGRGQHAGPGRQVHQRAFVVAGQQGIQLSGVGAQCVGERLGDPARMGVDERGVPDRIGIRRWGQLVDPGLFVPCGDRAQHTVDETRSRRIEFDAGLLDGGGDRGVRVDPGAQQLVGAQPQQVQQHGVDALGRAPGGVADDGVEQAAGAAGAVGQFGGERRVAAGDSALAQQGGQRQIGVGVALRHRPQHVERRAAGRVERFATRRGSSAAPVAGHWARRRSRRAGRRAPSRRRPSACGPAAECGRAAPAAIRCRPARRRGRPELHRAATCSAYRRAP